MLGVLFPREVCPIGASRCQLGDGAGVAYPQGAECGPALPLPPGMDGGTEDTPCASELVTPKTEERLKPSLQLMPIINPAVSVVSLLFVQTVDAG